MSGGIAGLALVIALLGVGGCGGAHADSPTEAAERWLDAVQDGRYEQACEYLTPKAKGGFDSINTIGLPVPRKPRARECAASMEIAAERLPDGLLIGEEEGGKEWVACAEEGVPGEGASIEWRLDGVLIGWQAVCRGDDGWLLGSGFQVNAVPA